MNSRIGTFLRTFEGEEGNQSQQQSQQQVPAAQQQVPAAQQQTPAPAPQAAPQPPPQESNGGQVPSIPASALPEILAAMSQQGQAAAQQLADARKAHQQAQQQQAPAPQPPSTQRDKIDLLVEQVSQLTEQNNKLQLETYRQAAMNKAQQSGVKLVDSLVYGATPAEIDASLQVAAAEYQLISAAVAEDLKKQLAQQPPAQQQQQPAAQATVSQVGGQPVAQPQQQHTVPQQNNVSAPGMVQAPGVPSQNADLYTPEQIKYLTTHGLRTGEYAQHREKIQAQLRGQLNTPGSGWSFTTFGPQIAPPVPSSAPAQPAPAVQQSMYAGMQLPQVQPTHQFAGQQQPAAPQPPPPTSPVAGHPMHQNQVAAGPPQPGSMQAGAPFDAGAARFAAENSVAQARMRANMQPNPHSQ